MKGLLIKDLKLLKNQRNLLLIICVMGAFLVLGGVVDASFLVAWLPFMAMIVVMSTLSYDDLDNGVSFLLTLPVTRREYVKEKYLLGISLGGGVWLLTVLLSGLSMAGLHSDGNMAELLGSAVGVGLFLTVFLGWMIPVQIKFGSEKGRVVIYGGFLAVIGLVYLASKAFEGREAVVQEAVNSLKNVPEWGWILAVLAFVGLILGISYRISVGIMEKKEF